MWNATGSTYLDNKQEIWEQGGSCDKEDGGGDELIQGI